MYKMRHLVPLCQLLFGVLVAATSDTPAPSFAARAPGQTRDVDHVEARGHHNHNHHHPPHHAHQQHGRNKHGHHHHHHHHHHGNNGGNQQQQQQPQQPPESQATGGQHNTVQWNSDGWKLVKRIDSTNFFDEMDTFVGPDPSRGMVYYSNMGDARSKGLVNTDNGKIYMALSKNKIDGMYHTIRPSTKTTFTEGIVIVNVEHMPAACGGWPAIFTVSKNGNWPEDGEIDIAEGVHFYRSNKMSIHTNPGCYMEKWALGMMTGQLGSESSTNCAAWQTGDKGCAVQSYGQDFGVAINDNGGGTYMMVWSEDHGIAVYHSPDMPSDIAEGKPDPTKWGKPTAYWPPNACSPAQFFRSHSLTITNTFGGDWAGNDQVWHWKGSMGQSCAQKTGFESFWDYAKHPDLSEAYWTIKDIQIWQKHRKP